MPAVSSGHPVCGKCKQPLPWLATADDETFEQVATAPVPVLVDLWAPWCAPCRALGPLLDAQAAGRAGTLKVVRVNVDNSPQLAARFDARSIPLMIMLSQGRVIARQVGALNAGALDAWISRAIGS